MFHGMHGRGGGHRRGMGGGDRWAAFAEQFASRWEEAQHGRGGGRRRRVFDGGELRLVLLKLIADEPRHGYDLIREVESLSGGAYAPSAGVVYPTLTLLDEMGLIEEQRADGAKKRFAATADGRAHLADRQEEVDELLARLTELGTERNRVGWMRAPIQRAMGNLRHAIQDRVPKGDLADDALFEIAAILDEAAQKIERLK